MKNENIASEFFSSGEKYYFLDFKLAKNKSHYLRITRSDATGNSKFKKSSIVIFEEDFELFINALSSLIHHARFKDKAAES